MRDFDGVAAVVEGRLTLEPVGQDQPTRAPLAVIEDFHKFRARLDDCAPEALQKVVMSLPMSTWLAHQFLYGGSLDVRASGKAALEQLLLMGGEEIRTATPAPRGKTAGTS